MGLLRFLLWCFFIYYLIKIVARLVAPFLIKRFVNKMQERVNQQFSQQYQRQQKPPQEEGKVTLEKTNNATKSKSDNIGEYVDFEEVDQ